MEKEAYRFNINDISHIKGFFEFFGQTQYLRLNRNIPLVYTSDEKFEWKNWSICPDIDNILGLYKSKENEIILYIENIKYIAEKHFDIRIYEDLKSFVLLHELGHWMRLQSDYGIAINPDNVVNNDFIEEGYVQWVIYKYAESIKITDSSFSMILEKSTKTQSDAYNFYNLLKPYNNDLVFCSMVESIYNKKPVIKNENDLKIWIEGEVNNLKKTIDQGLVIQTFEHRTYCK